MARNNAGIFQRYFKLKARHLGVKKLRRYDIYAPVARRTRPSHFDAAAEMVLDSFSEFEPRVGELARRVFDEDHLDSEVRKGKHGGAFCCVGLPRDDPLRAAQLPGPRARCGHDGA